MKLKNIVIYFTSIIRVFGIIGSALFLPWFFLVYQHREQPIESKNNTITTGFKLGIENISQDFIRSTIHTKNSALITNKSGISQIGIPSAQILFDQAIALKKIITNDTQFACPPLLTTKRSLLSIPIVSLTPESQIHTLLERYVKDVEIIFFDMQDNGLRYYQTLQLLFETLKIGALYQKTIIVFDRPNVAGGFIEGTIDGTELPLPLRYGMTIGELARYFNFSLLHKSAQLYVIPMENYERQISQSTNPAQLISLATNIDIFQQTSLLPIFEEVHPFDLAKTTKYAYQCILLPESLRISKQKWYELKNILENAHIKSNFYRYYCPDKHQYMSGLRFKLEQSSEISFSTLLTMLRFFHECGIKMTFSDTFDKTIGSKKIRQCMEGKLSWSTLEADINKGLKHFFTKAQKAFIYKPYPKVTLL